MEREGGVEGEELSRTHTQDIRKKPVITRSFGVACQLFEVAYVSWILI